MDERGGYRNRTDAGRRLADALKEELTDVDDAIVLALPRGGLPVAYEVARVLQRPLDLILVRKLGLPVQPELAMGAIARGGVRVLNPDVVSMADVDREAIEAVEEDERAELERRERSYRGPRPAPGLEDRTVVLVDDGVATGSTLRAAIRAVRQRGARRIVVAVPVSSPEALEKLRSEADRLVCPMAPERFAAIGAWYEDFSQVSDEEVRAILQRAWEEEGLAPASDGAGGSDAGIATEGS